VWVIWASSPYYIIVTLAPLLIFLGALGESDMASEYLCKLFSVPNTGVNIFWDYGQLSGTLHSQSENTVLSTVTGALMAAFTIICSSLLVGRIIHTRRRIVSLIGERRIDLFLYTFLTDMMVHRKLGPRRVDQSIYECCGNAH
jgi:hypothetical protein